MKSTLRHKTYKVELRPTSEQIIIIERTMGICRYVYNLFIATNRGNYRNSTQSYMSGYDFSKWLNNEYRKANPDKLWIWEVSSKAVKKAMMNADTAYKNFMRGKEGIWLHTQPRQSNQRNDNQTRWEIFCVILVRSESNKFCNRSAI